MKPTSVLMSTFVTFFALAGVAQSQARTVLQTVPNSDTDHPSGLVQGDEWAFDGAAGDTVAIGVDTRDDNGDLTSNLDPLIFLVRPNGSIAVIADDETACSRAQICGYACPSLEAFTLDQTGSWTIAVLNFGIAPCKGGAYNLSITGSAARITKTLRLELEDGALSRYESGQRPEQPKGSSR